MRSKLMFLGGAVIFFLVGAGYFRTPASPVPGLLRPSIDRSLFEGSHATGPRVPGKVKPRNNRRRSTGPPQSQRDFGDEESKTGFLGRLLGKNRAEPDGIRDAPIKPPHRPTSIKKKYGRSGGKNKKDFLAKRREERRKRMEARRTARRDKARGATIVKPRQPTEDEHLPPPLDLPEDVFEEEEMPDEKEGPFKPEYPEHGGVEEEPGDIP